MGTAMARVRFVGQRGILPPGDYRLWFRSLTASRAPQQTEGWWNAGHGALYYTDARHRVWDS